MQHSIPSSSTIIPASQPTSPTDSLPDLAIAKIAEFCKGNIASFALTCKRFRNVVCDVSKKASLECHFETFKNAGASKHSVFAFPDSEHFKNLEEISIKLTRPLIICKTQINDIFIYRKLTTLNIDLDVERLNDRFFLKLKKCRQLQHLHLKGCRGVTNRGWQTLLENADQLRSLSLSNLCCDNTQMNVKNDLSHLTFLTFMDSSNLTDSQLADFLKVASKLRKLAILNCDQISGTALMQLSSDQLTAFELKSFKPCSPAHSFPAQIRSDSLIHLISQNLNLEELILKNCSLARSFTDLYLQKRGDLFLKKLKLLKLEGMNIKDCNQLICDAVQLEDMAIINCSDYENNRPDLRGGLPELKKLKIVHTKIDAQSIQSILQSSHHLTDLELGYTEERNMAWDEMHLRSLRSLKISSFVPRDSFFTGRDLGIVARSALNLEDLSINLTTEEDFGDLEGTFTQLRSVEIQGDLSDEQLDEIKARSELLKRFEVVRSDGSFFNSEIGFWVSEKSARIIKYYQKLS